MFRRYCVKKLHPSEKKKKKRSAIAIVARVQTLKGLPRSPMQKIVPLYSQVVSPPKHGCFCTGVMPNERTDEGVQDTRAKNALLTSEGVNRSSTRLMLGRRDPEQWLWPRALPRPRLSGVLVRC